MGRTLPRRFDLMEVLINWEKTHSVTVLIRRKESDAYLATDSRPLELVDYDEKRLNIVAFSPHCGLHQLKRKAAVRAESYNISSFFIVTDELQ